MIRRDPDQAQSRSHDLIVIGAGIYGVAMTLEAARRGLRVVLLERDDFGGATTWNSLRILHGGLRYLQTLDLPRFFESVAERRWFCRHFPDLVKPLPCLMPLYGRGMKRPGFLRIALSMNDALSARRNAGVEAACHLPGGRVLSADEVRDHYPEVPRHGLKGGALWYDVVMPNPQRILIEMLHWACAAGAIAMNYVSATALRVEGGRVQGVEAYDRVADRALTLDAPVVFNCAGPWSRALGAKFDRDIAALFEPALAFNVLLDRPPLSDVALAIEPHGGPTYFMHPYQERIMVGTSHWPWSGPVGRPYPTDQQLDHFLRDLNRAAPALRCTPDSVLRVFAGLLPSRRAGAAESAVREVVHDHGQQGGPRGLFSLSGVKYTTARRVAADALARVWSERGGLPPQGSAPRPIRREGIPFGDARWLSTPVISGFAPELQSLIQGEAVFGLDDLLMRRTDWITRSGEHDASVENLRRLLAQHLVTMEPNRWAPQIDPVWSDERL